MSTSEKIEMCIRDNPKTASGSDLMSGAPSAVSGAQLKDVSLRLM